MKCTVNVTLPEDTTKKQLLKFRSRIYNLVRGTGAKVDTIDWDFKKVKP